MKWNVEKLLKKAKKTADAEYNKIIERANKDAHEIRKRARATGESQKEQILKDTEKEIAQMALVAASKAVGKQKGSEVDKALYDEFLKKQVNKSDRGNNSLCEGFV